MATTGVPSDLEIDASAFVKYYLYMPYSNVPGEVTLSRPHSKQFFALALIPPGGVDAC